MAELTPITREEQFLDAIADAVGGGGGGGSGAEKFVITLTDSGNNTYTPDKTFAEMVAAYENGDRLVIVVPDSGGVSYEVNLSSISEYNDLITDFYFIHYTAGGRVDTFKANSSNDYVTRYRNNIPQLIDSLGASAEFAITQAAATAGIDGWPSRSETIANFDNLVGSTIDAQSAVLFAGLIQYLQAAYAQAGGAVGLNIPDPIASSVGQLILFYFAYPKFRDTLTLPIDSNNVYELRVDSMSHDNSQNGMVVFNAGSTSYSDNAYTTTTFKLMFVVNILGVYAGLYDLESTTFTTVPFPSM